MFAGNAQGYLILILNPALIAGKKLKNGNYNLTIYND